MTPRCLRAYCWTHRVPVSTQSLETLRRDCEKKHSGNRLSGAVGHASVIVRCRVRANHQGQWTDNRPTWGYDDGADCEPAETGGPPQRRHARGPDTGRVEGKT